MKHYKFWIRTIFITVLCACILYYYIQLTHTKRYYQQQVKTALTKFVQQQEDLLQKLGQQLAPMLQKQDYYRVSQLLSLYEDQVFVLAKHDFTIPVAIQFVSLNAPQEIINSHGILDPMMLAPDDAYYMRATGAPTHLECSKVYTLDAMPNHKLMNIGYGVHAEDKYLGHLDAQLSVAALEAFLQADLKQYSNLFKLQFANEGLEAPQISLQPTAYWSGLLQPVIVNLAITVFLIGLGFIFYKLYLHSRIIASALAQSQLQVAEISSLLSMYKSILATQYKYGSLALLDQSMKQVLDVQQLLHDIKSVNADLIQQRSIKLIFPQQTPENFYIQANNLLLMQILSGILYEILIQLPNGSTVELQITTQNISRKQQKVVFTFIDNGFYSTLQNYNEQNSMADVRAKGWENIKRLLNVEDATLEHVHTAYVGNTISVSIVQQLTDNVINLSFQ